MPGTGRRPEQTATARYSGALVCWASPPSSDDSVSFLPAWTLLLLALVVWIVLASLSWAAAESVRYHMRLRRSYSRDAESPGDLRDASTGTPKPPAFAESSGSRTSRKC